MGTLLVVKASLTEKPLMLLTPKTCGGTACLRDVNCATLGPGLYVKGCGLCTEKKTSLVCVCVCVCVWWGGGVQGTTGGCSLLSPSGGLPVT